MRFGPTSLQTTRNLAKGLRRPKFRTSLRVSEQVFGGETSYMMKVPETSAYYRIMPYEYEMLLLFDGTHTAAEVAQEVSERYPASPFTEQQVLEFIDSWDSNVWERSLGERNLAVLEKIRQERKGRLERSSVCYFVVTSWESDRFLTRLYPYFRWCFSPGFVVFCLALFAMMAGLIATDYARIEADTLNFYKSVYDSLYNFWVFWVLMFFVVGLHELGHGLTCKHFGGEVPHMGVFLVYFNPAFFTDTSDVVLFDKTSKRQWTTLAGLWVEMIVCSFATFAWYFSRPGSLLNTIGYQVLLFTGISALFFNLNPLIKFDGYYVLSDFLEIERLSERSYEYLWAWVRKYILRHPVELPPASRRQRRIFLIYSAASLLYRVFVIWIVLLLARGFFVKRLGTVAGYALTFGLVYLILRKRIRKTVPFLRAEARSLKERLMKWKMSRERWVGVAVLAAILIVPFSPDKVSTEFVLEPGERAYVRAPVPGLISQVTVHEGDWVEAGAVLGVLHNPNQEARTAILAQRLEESEHSLLAAQARNDVAEIAKSRQEVRRVEAALADARAKLAGLTLRSPVAGVVTTPQIDQKIGSYIVEGNEFAVVSGRRKMKARVLVQDLDFEDVHLGTLVKLKVRANPFHTYSGYVQQIMPATAPDQPVADPKKIERYGQELTNYFAVTLEIPNPKGDLQEGMTGTAKVFGHRSPLIYRAGREFWRWLQSQIW